MEQYINDFLLYMKDVKHASKNTMQAYQNDLKKLMSILGETRHQFRYKNQ